MTFIETRVSEIERVLVRVLEREGATSDQGCSALANTLLAALVKCRKDPRVRADVSQQMRLLAAKLIELSAKEDKSADDILAGMGITVH